TPAPRPGARGGGPRSGGATPTPAAPAPTGHGRWGRSPGSSRQSTVRETVPSCAARPGRLESSADNLHPSPEATPNQHPGTPEAMPRFPLLAALSLSAAALSAQPPRAPAPLRSPGRIASVDTALLRGLRYRLVGPSRGGRVTSVTGVPSQPRTFYMG